ncbi:MAG: xanthine dehydrogenase family protein subunit M [Candidatus Bathyarchaeia archaeon]
MRPQLFEYYSPSSLNEVLDLLHSNEEAKVLAGGQSLISLMKLRVASPQALVDISCLEELSYIREESGIIGIGALVRHDQLERDNVIRKQMPLLSDAAAVIADQQIRNRGTIGGSLAHADPAADLPTAFSALNATIITASINGSRSIETGDFFRDYFTTALTHDEIIKEVRITIPTLKYGNAHLKLSKSHNDFAIVAAAAQIIIGSDQVCNSASIVLGGVASTPVHAEETEKLLKGSRLDDDVIERSAQKASEGLKPPSDIRASAEYRLKMARKLTQRTIMTSVQRARGGA